MSEQPMTIAPAVLAAIEAAGYAVVPVSPTEAMVRAGCMAVGRRSAEALMAAELSGDRHAVARLKMHARWDAMLAAAKAVPATEPMSQDSGAEDR